MPYRTVKYHGETMTAIEKRIEEIKQREETIIDFVIETY